MSDNNNGSIVAAAQQGEKRRIFYGSLEGEVERMAKRSRTANDDNSNVLSLPPPSVNLPPGGIIPAQDGFSAAIAAGIRAGNINIGSSSTEVHELSEGSLEAKSKQAELLRSIEAKRRARSIIVPTNDEVVRVKLRMFGEPITLFGERAPQRRDRLKVIMARAAAEYAASTAGDPTKAPKEAKIDPDAVDEKGEKKKAFLIEGTEALRQCRLHIAKFSLPRARARVANQRADDEKSNDSHDTTDAADRLYNDQVELIKSYRNASSEIGDVRPMSALAFSPSSTTLATGSWSGACKLWSVADSKHIATFKGHTEMVTDVAFHPASGISLTDSVANLATCGAETVVRLWPLVQDSSASLKALALSLTGDSNVPDIAPIATLKGHQDRLARLAYHPSGRYLGSTSYDNTWMLWDLETEAHILRQRGHSRSTYGIAFQCDGSLCATGDLGGNGHLWDLRSGKSIWTLRGHSKMILSIDFSPNGYQIATGSDDHTVRIWDLRKKNCAYTIPAHPSLVSNVRWQPVHGNWLLSSSYDNTCKIWSSRDYSLIKTLAGHESKVMKAEPSPDGECIASVSFDRTWKLWRADL